jgi:hypothetical protein
VAVDRTFGSTGSIWTGVPTERRDYFGVITGTVFLGGTAVGLALDPSGPNVVVSRWHPDGRHDASFGNTGLQEAGFDHERIEFTPAGVLPRSGTELLVYGQAGRLESQTHTVGTTTYTTTTIRRQEPAIFRILDPGGIDAKFGSGGAEVFPLQEFQASVVEARLLQPASPLGADRVRFVCTDNKDQDLPPKDPMTTFGGVGEFTLTRPRPPRPPHQVN